MELWGLLGGRGSKKNRNERHVFQTKVPEVVLTSSNNLNVHLSPPPPKILGANMDLVAREIGKPVRACLFVVGRGLGCSSTKRDFRSWKEPSRLAF